MKCLQGHLASLPYHEGSDTALKSESVFRNVIAGIFLLTGQLVHTEKHTSQERIDSVVETPEHVYIFEFKVDKSVEEALEQIEQSGYATFISSSDIFLCVRFNAQIYAKSVR